MNWYKTIGWLLGSLFVLSIVIGRLPIEGRTKIAALVFEGGVSYWLFAGVIMYIIALVLRELREDLGCLQIVPLFFGLGFLLVYTLFGFIIPELGMIREDLVIYGKIEQPEEKLILQWCPGFDNDLWRAIITKEKEAIFRRYTTVNLELIKAQGDISFLSEYGGGDKGIPSRLNVNGEIYILEEQHPMNY